MSLSAAFFPSCVVCWLHNGGVVESFTTAEVAPYEYKHEAVVQLLIGAWWRALRGVGGSLFAKSSRSPFSNHLHNCSECGGPRCKAA